MVELDWNNVPKDMCPVCKTDKYLSPEIQFKINPECYHKICDACVDRIFSLGPSPCPYPNCGKILRKNKFKTQVFDDLEVEKECDIRRRVLNIYNKKEADFPLTDDYNSYQEEIEDIVYKLLHKIDVEKTEEQLKEYSIANKQSIRMNNARSDQEYEKFIRLQKLEKQYKSQRNRLNRQIIHEQANLKNLEKMKTIDELQQPSEEKNSEAVIKSVKESMKNRSNKYKKQLVELENKYLKQREIIIKNQQINSKKKKEVKIPFTPFNGDRMIPMPYRLEPNRYKDPYMEKMVDDVQFMAGGYKLDLYYERSLNEAFTGLNCYIEEEKAN
ncbi:DEKNAAC105160 [Brettanomyces naardenensis]|uniref:RNA polymerase II transcription factor B subunit 3 n=1 Tax=Brettanomyces naardenensis TaxID=13370 RepID=A0A448YSN7_BRENA|nr:DEKNAAC105160 [Brettanomyces naardenensis]